MSQPARTRQAFAQELMDEFARGTGLTGGAPPRRYLWTDAFAVCNFLGLHRESGDGRPLDLALSLVDQVHHVLGRYRPDDTRRGWISGLPEAEGERHPTRGGLRIGKPLPERRADEPFDDRLEWDRDGQYFHYLTQWMHALTRVAEETGQPVFEGWAVELATTAHSRFTSGGSAGSPQRLVWKMSTDLGRALVPSMGQHDALDAWLTYLELRAGSAGPVLDREIAEAAALSARNPWETDDALGIGGLLIGIFRVVRMFRMPRLPHLPRTTALDTGLTSLRDRLVTSARISLDAYMHGKTLGRSAESRLAFRELGLAIGLHALERIERSPAIDDETRGRLAPLARQCALAARIDDFWCEPANRQALSWTEHRDINTVMLATSLSPDGTLGPL